MVIDPQNTRICNIFQAIQKQQHGGCMKPYLVSGLKAITSETKHVKFGMNTDPNPTTNYV